MKKQIIFLLGLFLCSALQAQNIERYMNYHDKGRMLILEGKYQSAISYLDTAINIMPYYPTIFLDRGYAKMQVKQYDNAISDFTHVLNKKPYLTEARLQRGMAYYHVNRLDESEQDLLLVMKSNPSKSQEVILYLNNIRQERELIADKNRQTLYQLKLTAENERIKRARHREEVIWNSVVPLAFWTTVFLTW
ncbi:tetratricopeptide repeat protein [Marinifilum sp. RC60d5]|uniref:tetratricopeptide repeat protein n=1 Tax=Marinifilum sp. RC60d5 TaxID=3458414 RepID=UPI0040355B4B